MSRPIAAALSLAALMALSACSDVVQGDPLEGQGVNFENRTVLTFVEGLGNQVVHFAPDGRLAIWRTGTTEIQRGRWKFDRLNVGSTTAFVGQAGINYPVEAQDTEVGVCLRYETPDGQILRLPNGGDWNCNTLAQFDSLVTERLSGDPFNLLTAPSAPDILPANRPVSAAEL